MNSLEKSRTLHTAQGRFSNGWVAVYYGEFAVYYGYGKTELEAKEDLMLRVHPDEDLTGQFTKRECHNPKYAT